MCIVAEDEILINLQVSDKACAAKLAVEEKNWNLAANDAQNEMQEYEAEINPQAVKMNKTFVRLEVSLL